LESSNPLDVGRETKPGKYADGDGLYLIVAIPSKAQPAKAGLTCQEAEAVKQKGCSAKAPHP
jgi:hypothetical protein